MKLTSAEKKVMKVLTEKTMVDCGELLDVSVKGTYSLIEKGIIKNWIGFDGNPTKWMVIKV
jgi:hypothetical protein